MESSYIQLQLPAPFLLEIVLDTQGYLVSKYIKDIPTSNTDLETSGLTNWIFLSLVNYFTNYSKIIANDFFTELKAK